MTATTTHPFPSVADIAPAPVPTASSYPTAGRPVTRSGRWALWGVAAGLLGMGATMFTDGQGALYEEGETLGVEAIQEVSRSSYHVGIVLGIAATFCLLVVAAGWRRWAAERAPDDLAARVIPMALTASAGAMILGYGMKGSLAVYLDGGMDQGTFTDEGLFSVFMFLDFAPYVVWWGVCFAAIAATYLSLRHGYLPRWLGVVGIPLVLAPIAFMVATGLPGFPGLTASVWLVIASVAMALGGRGRRARA